MRRLSTTIRIFLLSSLLFSQLARAERLPTAVLWLDGGTPELVSAVDAQLSSSKALAPLDDLQARQLLVTGGAAGRVATKFATGKEHFAALELPQADADLEGAEAIAIAELRVADACEKLLPIERLRLRYAELKHDEPAAQHAAKLLVACSHSPSVEDADAIKRHPSPATPTPSTPMSSARIETEPPGAAVFLDLQEIGKTPLVLSPNRSPSAMLDLELPGYRKLHRAAPETGTLTIALSRDDRLPELVDRIRATDGNAPDAQLADLGRRVGAARLIVLRRDAEKQPPTGTATATTMTNVQGRVLDVNSSRWIGAPELVAGSTATETATRLIAWASGEIPHTSPNGNVAAAAPTAPVVAVVANPPAATTTAPPAAKPAPPVSLASKADLHTIGHAPPLVPVQQPADNKPAWKKWYTWAIGGALVAVIGGFLIAQQIGDNQVTVDVSH